MNFSPENTTHEEACRLLNDRESKIIDLYNSLSVTQAQNTYRLKLLLEIWKECTYGQIAESLPINPFSIDSIKQIDKLFSTLK